MKQIYDIETTGLHSISDRITCISLLNVDQEIPYTMYGEDERNILKQFWIAVENTTELIGWNSNGFDWGFIIHRSLINQVKVSNNWNIIKLTDLKNIVNQFFVCYDKRIKGKLGEWAEHLMLGTKETDGLEVIEAYKRKDWKTVKEHCEFDVKVTKALLQRCKDVGIIK